MAGLLLADMSKNYCPREAQDWIFLNGENGAKQLLVDLAEKT